MMIITISMMFLKKMILSLNHLLSTNTLSVTMMIILGSKASLRSLNNKLPVNTKRTMEKDSKPSKKPTNLNIFNSTTILKIMKKLSIVLIKFKRTGLLPSPLIS